MAERLSEKLVAALTDQFGLLPEFEADAIARREGYMEHHVDDYSPQQGYVRFIQKYSKYRRETSEYVLMDPIRKPLARRRLSVDDGHGGLLSGSIAYLDGRVRKTYKASFYDPNENDLGVALSYHSDTRNDTEDIMPGQNFGMVNYSTRKDGQRRIVASLPFPFAFIDQVKFAMQYPGFVKTQEGVFDSFRLHILYNPDETSVQYPDSTQKYQMGGQLIQLDEEYKPTAISPTKFIVRETPRLFVCEFENPSVDYSFPRVPDYRLVETHLRSGYDNRNWTQINDQIPVRLSSPTTSVLLPLGSFA